VAREVNSVSRAPFNAASIGLLWHGSDTRLTRVTWRTFSRGGVCVRTHLRVKSLECIPTRTPPQAMATNMARMTMARTATVWAVTFTARSKG
jgi:hypothetical protein